MSARIYDPAAGVPIAGFTGPNGAGKTALAVQSAIADMARGRPVYSTVAIECEYGTSRPIPSLSTLLDLEPGSTVLLDEISSIFSSRTGSTLPPEFDTFIGTARHSSIAIRWTAPAWMRAENRVREVTQGLVSVSPFIRRPDPEGSLWPRTIIAQVGVLDCIGVKTDADPDVVRRRRFVRLKGLRSWGCYDTHAPVVSLVNTALFGTCPDCGGTRTRPKCDGARHQQLGLAAPRVSNLLHAR